MTVPADRDQPPSALSRALGTLDLPLRELLDRHHANPAAARAVMFARCWPDDRRRRGATRIVLERNESLESGRKRLQLLWNPGWLIDAGFTASDANGVVLEDVSQRATAAGAVQWDSELPLPRVDDKASLEVTGDALAERRIVAGEVAVLAMWARDGLGSGVSVEDIAVELSMEPESGRAARGARWNAGVAYLLERELPGWRIETQVSIRDIFGLHLRAAVVQRKADAVLVSDSNKVMALLSAKFSWRSDRGTEAAQMVYLNRHRPDLPYVLATAEFPRALGGLTTESIEDQTFHLASAWVGAWKVTQETPNPGEAFPTLQDLASAGTGRVPGGVLPGLDQLVTAVVAAARYS